MKSKSPWKHPYSFEVFSSLCPKRNKWQSGQQKILLCGVLSLSVDKIIKNCSKINCPDFKTMNRNGANR